MTKSGKINCLTPDSANANRLFVWLILCILYLQLQPIMEKLDTTFIYALCDPETDDVRYVGKSNDPTLRLRRHIRNARDGHTFHCPVWIRSVLIRGLKPKLVVIEECPAPNWKEREIFWIDWYKAKGYDLTNCKAGGDGGEPGPETRHKMRLAKLGKTPHNKGVKASDAVRQKQSEAAKRRIERDPEETKRRMDIVRAAGVERSKGRLGQKKTAEEIEKIRLSLLGNTRSKGYKFSDEQKRKLSESHKGRVFTEETLQKISDTKALRFAQKKGGLTRQQMLEHPALFDGTRAEAAERFGVSIYYITGLRTIVRKTADNARSDEDRIRQT